MVTTFNSNSKLKTKLDALPQLVYAKMGFSSMTAERVAPSEQSLSSSSSSSPPIDVDEQTSVPITYSTRKNPTKHFNFDEKILYEDVIQVNCNSYVAELHKNKFGSGGKGRCIKVVIETSDGASVDKWMTPIEFETYCGKGNCRDWKRTLKAGGQQILAILDAGILTCHAVSCSCAVCNQNESLVGPIKPFMRYRRRKKDEIVAQNAFKKFLSLKPPTLMTDLSFNTCPNSIASPIQKLISSSTPNKRATHSALSINTQLHSTDDLVRLINKIQQNDDNKWNTLEQMAKEMISQAKNLQSQIEIQRKESEVNRKMLIEKLLQTTVGANSCLSTSSSSSSSSMTHSSRKRKLCNTHHHQYTESYDYQYDNEFVDECYNEIDEEEEEADDDEDNEANFVQQLLVDDNEAETKVETNAHQSDNDQCDYHRNQTN